MRYALNLPIGGPAADPRRLGELAALAEDAGWDAVFVEDYIVYQNRQDVPTYDPWVALAAMALATSRVRLGTMVASPSRRRPWKLAREAVTLDHLSGGRLILGVGLGDPTDTTFATFAEETDLAARAAMTDEALDVLAGLWTGEPFGYEGRHYRFGEVTFLPPPVQRPRIPIWIGGGYPNPGPLRRAARWDGAWLYRVAARGETEDTGGVLTPDELRELRRLVEARRPSGAPFDLVVHGPQPGRDPGRERERLCASAEAGATWTGDWIAPAEPDVMRAAVARGPLRIA
jgi:alkanesulfonate monooxygenase SsuD/methylene tetrahydromethanopterin reductase-like flavin-dependent oxidoreductase (luciferase family)